MARGIAQLRQRGIHRIHQLDERTHGWLGMLVSAARQTLQPDSTVTAAAIAYFALFSLFPLILLSIAIASFTLGPLMDQQLVVQEIEFIAPALGQLLGPNIAEIIRARGPVTMVALVSLIWSASNLIYMLTGSLVEIKKESPRQVRASKQEQVFYQLTMEITDLQTGLIAWTTQKERLRGASKPLVGW